MESNPPTPLGNLFFGLLPSIDRKYAQIREEERRIIEEKIAADATECLDDSGESQVSGHLDTKEDSGFDSDTRSFNKETRLSDTTAKLNILNEEEITSFSYQMALTQSIINRNQTTEEIKLEENILKLAATSIDKIKSSHQQIKLRINLNSEKPLAHSSKNTDIPSTETNSTRSLLEVHGKSSMVPANKSEHTSNADLCISSMDQNSPISEDENCKSSIHQNISMIETKSSLPQESNTFITPCRPFPHSKVVQSLPAKSAITDSSHKPRILCSIDMRKHLKTPIFQMSKTKSARKHLLSTSNLGPVLEDDLVDKTQEADNRQPLSKQLVEDIFKCITVKNVEYIVLNELGRGGSSVVYHCYDPNTREERAVKVVDLKKDRNGALGFINEVKALKRLQDCDHIIKLFDYDILNGEKTLYMVLEKGGRDFSQILREHSRNTTHLPNFMVHYYWMQMLYAVQQMHLKGVIHSDLKPSNFIEIRERLKLIDFGISSLLQLDMTSVVKTIALGTLGYVSPEALYNDGGCGNSPHAPKFKVGFRSDVWSLGCILYQLVYKRTPFAHIRDNATRIATMVNPNHTINYPPADWVHDGVIQCMKACLQYNLRKRPTIIDLINAGNNMNNSFK